MPASRYSCILWDVDGTIADASAGILPRLRQVFASYGLPEPAPEALAAWIGPPMFESFQLHAGMTPEQAEEALGRYRALAAADGYAASVALYPGVADVIRAVSDAGIPQATASTKPENQVAAILEHYELLAAFTAISGARPGPEGRSDGKSFVVARALERLADAGADVSSPVLIGDRHHDIDGAAEHGIPVIFAEWGFGDAGEGAGAVHRAAAPEQLRSLLLA
ncbi:MULTISPECIES: HAD hydrolase-like protein [Microbacterium]|uniref:HAD hydrolase-like protein n=1 Tax=Microbacterium TaxID=33882 RepID=UPI00217DDEA1|nr:MULTISPECIES: HAD hydrolase-like protein [Microbacterium]UWF77565.1 HAD hydrolase-like protein [Microbacterium neungamense]WCM55735.1 HAD hydrolase-like protein [Microbacterium sp. EF45047]